jgi:pimeloyl-ACP methyl ester carboxylesterase
MLAIYFISRGRSSELVIVLASVLFVGGCAAPANIPLRSDAAPFGQDVTLIYVPGIGGYGHNDRAWTSGLRSGGFSGNTEVWKWTGNLGPISALWDHARHRAEARRMADRIRALHSESPAKSLVLVGHSAGAGLAVMALEDLPPDVQVDEVVLLAPAVSRTYDLTRALRHVRGHADVFYSQNDTLVLEIGTFLFGTVDGVHGEAAGHGGFVRPPRGSSEAYAKLVVHPYSTDRRLYGDDGGHEGMLRPAVAAEVVAPLLPGHEAHQDVAQTDARDLP